MYDGIERGNALASGPAGRLVFTSGPTSREIPADGSATPPTLASLTINSATPLSMTRSDPPSSTRSRSPRSAPNAPRTDPSSLVFIDARKLILSSRTRAAKLSDDAGRDFARCRKTYEATSAPLAVTKTGPAEDDSAASEPAVLFPPAPVSGDRSAPVEPA